MLNLNALRDCPLKTSPFPHMVLPNFVEKDSCEKVNADYPKIPYNGSFPLSELSYGPQFQKLMDSLNGDPFRETIEEKFGIKLKGLPTMTSVRGKCALRDGRIHTDSVTKIITILIYMNSQWEKDGGRLRLLNNSHDLEDYFAEVPPVEGTLLAFEVTPNSWHGHLPFEGERRVIQFNWLTDANVAKSEVARHVLSAKIKKFKFWLKSLFAR